MDVWGEVYATAARQHGAISIQQVASRGLSQPSFRRRAIREGWGHPVPGIWTTPGATPSRMLRLTGALLAAGPHALVTADDGLVLHGLRARLPAIPRLVIPMERHAARHLGSEARLISSRTLRPDDASNRRGLAVATPRRCFVDLVVPPTPPVGVVRNLIVAARQRRLVTPADLDVAVARARGVPGIAVLRRAVADILDVNADSAFSDRVHRRLLRQGYRPDPSPCEVATDRRTLHPDITFRRARVAIECDSMLAHSQQRDLMIDNRKDRAYIRAGWVPLRIGPLEFDSMWHDFLRDLDDHLA